MEDLVRKKVIAHIKLLEYVEKKEKELLMFKMLRLKNINFTLSNSMSKI